jgi:hypothetical protein
MTSRLEMADAREGGEAGPHSFFGSARPQNARAGHRFNGSASRVQGAFVGHGQGDATSEN